MIRQFEQHIASRFPFLKKSKILLAVSGGIDSIVLFHLCKALSLDFSVAHCNFKLRGKESDEDAIFVKELAARNNIDVYIKEFDTSGYVEDHKVSVQMAARELRYAWFYDLLDSKSLDFLITAHHADDNLETFLINLSRKTGLDGLSGIPEQNDRILRPLLPFSREALLNFAKEEGIVWREDRTNSDTKYLRNRIRHNIIPELRKLNPAFMSNVNATFKNLQGSAAIIDNHIDTIKRSLFVSEGDGFRIELAALKTLEPRGAYFFELFSEFGFTEWNDLEHLPEAQTGKILYSATHRIFKDRDDLILEPLDHVESRKFSDDYFIESGIKEIEFPLHLSFEEVPELSSTNRNAIVVDAARLNFPLRLRKWREGDYFYPFGLKGKKKLSKFLKDEKFSLADKEAQWILTNANGEVIWVIGKRADDRFKVTETTRKLMRIKYRIL
ncbi:tRNA lysidine(34) synthetase TilS [Robertkochia solimangrovi]|uniref:tRNA lysidine(34) synthetase TilS n=1 Tax=Robertkochia solimangrovi TaxID=2213046 RepID=UPI00117FD052|nr:tRNA lysidine(34) synthetase TilS [Robertkochia solimangrovi]TRZ42551.1 tRNA lysidine(34) synthetase TilS [Robertkochia solimangrovi]